MAIENKNMLRFPYFLWLLPLFFVWHGFTENYPLVPLKDSSLLFLFYTGVATLLFFLFLLIFRNVRKAGLAAFAILCIQFFFGGVHDFLKKMAPGAFFTKYNLILPLILLSVIVFLILLKRSKRNFIRTARYLNTLLLVLLIVDAGIFLVRKKTTETLKSVPGMTFTACD